MKTREEITALVDKYQSLLDAQGYDWLNYSMWCDYLDELEAFDKASTP